MLYLARRYAMRVQESFYRFRNSDDTVSCGCLDSERLFVAIWVQIALTVYKYTPMKTR